MARHVDRLVQIVSYLAIAAIIVLSLVPGSARPQTGAPGQGEHVIAYFLTAGLFGLRCLTRRDVMLYGVALVVLAGAMESAQHIVPGRNAQLMDFVASAVGVLVGLIIGALFAPLYRRILRAWFG